MLLDLIAPLRENGYHFKESPIILHDQAFADDLSIITSTPELNQRSINVVLEFLAWFHLQANPKKCISMARNLISMVGQSLSTNVMVILSTAPSTPLSRLVVKS